MIANQDKKENFTPDWKSSVIEIVDDYTDQLMVGLSR